MPVATTKIPRACFATPLTDAILAEYEAMDFAKFGEEIDDAVSVLLRCVKQWWELPESQRTDGERFVYRKGPGGETVTIQERPLESAHVQSLWDAIPWMRELTAMEPLFDTLPNGKERNAAYHLIWYVKELTLDREPVTADQLGAA